MKIFDPQMTRMMSVVLVQFPGDSSSLEPQGRSPDCSSWEKMVAEISWQHVININQH